MQQDQQDNRGVIEKVTDNVNMAFMFTGVWMTAVTPFTRSHWGTRAFAWYGPFCLLFLLLYGGLTNQPDFFAFIPVWLLAVLYRRIAADRDQVSYYRGFPFPRIFRNERRARLVEVWLVGGVGIFLSIQEFRFGAFLIGAAVCMTINWCIEQAAADARNTGIEDALKMQRQQAEEMMRRR